MKNKKSLLFLSLFFAIVMVAFVSCKKDVSTENGSTSGPVPAGKAEMKIMLTDDPSVIFDSIFIDIQRVEVKVEDSTGAEHWDTLSIRAGVYNILNFRNGLDTLLAVGFVPNGEVEKIRITLGTRNSAVLNGVTIPLTNIAPQITVEVKGDVDHLDFNHLRIWLDFDGHGSIRFHNGRWELKLQIGHFGHHSSGELEGEIKPSAALPAMVSVVDGTDTLRAVPDHEGEFKIRGIKATTVKVIINPSNGYKDSVISNVIIRHNDDTDLGKIVLHR
ncbi:DUF4382 domain-containing protein [Ferruginibacter sp. SUN106]|uniref:DUF4382 domain-containing protein n=1 Tax=Ferruginibacter sp. SUN106 TaxID=2978348 RepID=UPI003D35E5F7